MNESFDRTVVTFHPDDLFRIFEFRHRTTFYDHQKVRHLLDLAGRMASAHIAVVYPFAVAIHRMIQWAHAVCPVIQLPIEKGVKPSNRLKEFDTCFFT